MQWIVKFNPMKTESLLFSRRINLQIHPTFFYNDVPIQEVVSHKHLWVYIYLNVAIGKSILSLSKKKLGHK